MQKNSNVQVHILFHPIAHGDAIHQDRSEHFGLGLYICKLLCERHSGYLRIDDIPDGAKVSACVRVFQIPGSNPDFVDKK